MKRMFYHRSRGHHPKPETVQDAEHILRLDALLNKELTEIDRNFIQSLKAGLARWGSLTVGQVQGLERVETRYSDEAAAAKANWIASFDDEKRKILKICATYYATTGYFHGLAGKALEDPDFIPSEKQYEAMCQNSYAKKIVEATLAEPAYKVGEHVKLCKGTRILSTPGGVIRQNLRNKHAIVLGTDVAPVISAAKGAKKYAVLIAGEPKPQTVEERDLKPATRERC
jgi:hypothetical protein